MMLDIRQVISAVLPGHDFFLPSSKRSPMDSYRFMYDYTYMSVFFIY